MPAPPADQAHLERGDKILAVNGTQVADWEQMSGIIKESAGKEVSLLIDRNGNEITTNIIPETSPETGKGAIGISPYQEEIVKKYGFFEAIVNGFKEAFNMIVAKVSGAAAETGIAQLLQFTCFISINLAVINLFPIPMLDGGHVLYLGIEAIKRKPLSQRSLEISQRIGLTLLIFIMFLAIYNDISRVKGDIVNSVNKIFQTE
mgnify:CR=1 FL=1